MRWRLCLGGVLLAGILGTIAQAAAISGRVYLDRNGNGRLDADEQGVAAVLVSDGRTVVATDAGGHYRLETAQTPAIVSITLPRNYVVEGPFWRNCDASHAEDFALISRPQPDDFFFIQITDTHLGRDDLLKLFAERVNAFPLPVAFVVNTGDLGGGVDKLMPDKAPPQFDRYLEAAKAFRVPLFNLPGNHEHVAHNVKEADRSDPLYGKGLYRRLLGPTYYSWDWGPAHFVALDGTTLPYQERLGDQQRAWLKADLSFQPPGKPIVLFCHQSLSEIRDATELQELLQGRDVLAGFCGHLHSTFTARLGDWPIYLTGALAGSWWSGPNPDGTPQGFRLVHIAGNRQENIYTNREGDCSLYVSSPSASQLQSGRLAFETVVLDFGKPQQIEARFAGQSVPVTLGAREPYWSTWEGEIDTTRVADGVHPLDVSVGTGEAASGACRMRYLVVNNRREPYRAEQSAELKLQVRSVHAPEEVLLDSQPLGIVPADTRNETTLTLPIPAARLQKLARVTVVAGPRGEGKDSFSVGPIWLEYGGQRIYDIRFPTFLRHAIGDGPSPRCQPQRDWYFSLP